MKDISVKYSLEISQLLKKQAHFEMTNSQHSITNGYAIIQNFLGIVSYFKFFFLRVMIFKIPY